MIRECKISQSFSDPVPEFEAFSLTIQLRIRTPRSTIAKNSASLFLKYRYSVALLSSTSLAMSSMETLS